MNWFAEEHGFEFKRGQFDKPVRQSHRILMHRYLALRGQCHMPTVSERLHAANCF